MNGFVTIQHVKALSRVTEGLGPMKSGNRGRPVPNPTGEPEDEVAEHVYAARLAGGFHLGKRKVGPTKEGAY